MVGADEIDLSTSFLSDLNPAQLEGVHLQSLHNLRLTIPPSE